MQNIKQLLPNVSGTERILEPLQTITKGPLISEQTKDVTAYFFMRLEKVYGLLFRNRWPDEKTLRMAKVEWAAQLGQYSREQLDKAFDRLHNIRQMPEVDRRYQYPDPDAVLGLVTNFLGIDDKVGCHKPFERLALPDKAAQERAKVAGAKALAEMKAKLRTPTAKTGQDDG